MAKKIAKKATRKKAVVKKPTQKTKPQINAEINDLKTKMQNLERELLTAATLPQELITKYKALYNAGYDKIFKAEIDGQILAFAVGGFWAESDGEIYFDEFEFNHKNSSKVFKIMDDQGVLHICHNNDDFVNFALKYSKDFKEWLTAIEKLGREIYSDYDEDPSNLV